MEYSIPIGYGVNLIMGLIVWNKMPPVFKMVWCFIAMNLLFEFMGRMIKPNHHIFNLLQILNLILWSGIVWKIITPGMKKILATAIFIYGIFMVIFLIENGIRLFANQLNAFSALIIVLGAIFVLIRILSTYIPYTKQWSMLSFAILIFFGGQIPFWLLFRYMLNNESKYASILQTNILTWTAVFFNVGIFITFYFFLYEKRNTIIKSESFGQ